MASHALLAASSSHRWLNCPPSARLSEGYEDGEGDSGSASAAEGTEAHRLCEYKLKTALGLPVQDPTDRLTYFTPEMAACAEGYAAYILERMTEAKATCSDPLVLIEQRLDFSAYAQEGAGTADTLVIADGILRVADFKYGQGVLVAAADNPQLMLYALGALELFDRLYDISFVNMTIYQPRRDNITTHTMTRESLYQWAQEVLKPRAKLAYAGEGEFAAGEHCRFCRAKAQCRARALADLELAAYDFREPALPSRYEIPTTLGKGEDHKRPALPHPPSDFSLLQ